MYKTQVIARRAMISMIEYRGNLKWLVDRTILFVRHGSHAYGLNTPESDEDFKGVAVPPIEYFHGFLNAFNQAESNEPDQVIYDIRKFCKLASDANPNIIEVLWAAPEHQLVATDLGKTLIWNRDLFLSKKVLYTFSGYAMSQLKRIKRHKAWLIDPPDHKPTRDEFGLPDKPVIQKNQVETALAMISKQVDSWEMNLQGFAPPQRQFIMDLFSKILSEMAVGQDDKWKAASGLLGFDTNFLEVLEKERLYKQARNRWKQYNDWKEKRNPARAKMEAEFGYDGKHAMHLVRLMRMGEEILSGEGVIVKRPDREELLSIRNGAWEYDQLIEWADEQDKRLREIAKESTIPKAPNRKEIDLLCQDIVMKTNLGHLQDEIDEAAVAADEALYDRDQLHEKFDALKIEIEFMAVEIEFMADGIDELAAKAESVKSRLEGLELYHE